MNPVLDKILTLLDVERIEENLYRGRNDGGIAHVFGGLVLAQAIASAWRTVEAPRRLHSLHAYFLRPGDHKVPTLYDVDRIRDGGSFTTRRVVAIQHGKAIFNMACSWQAPEQGFEHHQPMPDVAPPDDLRTDLDRYEELARTEPEVRRFSSRFQAIDSRQVEDVGMFNSVKLPPYKHTWMRTAEALPEDPRVHLGMLAYMSDMDFMSTSMLPHGRKDRGSIQGASLDHALWVHRPFRADEWLLFGKESPSATGARGFVRGFFWNQQGELVASAAQECLIRPR